MADSVAKAPKSMGLIFRQIIKARIADQCGLKPATEIACEFGGAWSPKSFFKRPAYGLENLSPGPQKDFATISARSCQSGMSVGRSLSSEKAEVAPISHFGSVCRVGPGNFTPSTGSRE